MWMYVFCMEKYEVIQKLLLRFSEFHKNAEDFNVDTDDNTHLYVNGLRVVGLHNIPESLTKTRRAFGNVMEGLMGIDLYWT